MLCLFARLRPFVGPLQLNGPLGKYFVNKTREAFSLENRCYSFERVNVFSNKTFFIYYSFIHSFIHSLNHSPIHSCIPPFIHSFAETNWPQLQVVTLKSFALYWTRWRTWLCQMKRTEPPSIGPPRKINWKYYDIWCTRTPTSMNLLKMVSSVLSVWTCLAWTGQKIHICQT